MHSLGVDRWGAPREWGVVSPSQRGESAVEQLARALQSRLFEPESYYAPRPHAIRMEAHVSPFLKADVLIPVIAVVSIVILIMLALEINRACAFRSKIERQMGFVLHKLMNPKT